MIASDEISADDIPDECPTCGEDLTIERRTEVDELYAMRRAETFKEHLRDEHPVIWFISSAIAKITVKLRRLKP